MAAGSCPGIYLHDGVHLNAVGYALLGNRIYEKMDALGYFDEVRDAKDIVFGDYE